MNTPLPIALIDASQAGASAALDLAARHLTEMDFDRLKLDGAASDPAFFAAAHTHLARCADCRRAFDALSAEDQTFALVPSALLRQRARPRRQVPWAVLGGSALAVAAGLFIALRPASAPLAIPHLAPSEVLVARGGALDFEVHVHDGTRSRLVESGGIVHPDERAGFGVRASLAGWVVVFGWDATGTPYAAYPAAADLATVRAAPLGASPEAVPLPGAVRFDALLGDEHLAAVWCPDPFALTDLVPSGSRVDTSALRDRLTPTGDATAVAGPRGCVMRETVLHKQAR